MFSVKKFERLTGHEPQTAACGRLWSASCNCTCNGKGQIFSRVDDSLGEALENLHAIIYRWHCQIVYIRQGGKCSRCGGLGPLDPHHIVKRSKNGRDDRVQNLEMLCRRDHDEEHGK